MSSDASQADRIRSVLDSAIAVMAERLAANLASVPERSRRLPRRVTIAAESNISGVLHAMEGPAQASRPPASAERHSELPPEAAANITSARASAPLGEALAHWCIVESQAGGAKVEDTVRSVALLLRRGGALAAALNEGRVAPRRLASAAVRGELGDLQQSLVDADESQLRAPSAGPMSDFFALGPVLRSVAAFLGPRSLCRLGAANSHLSRVCASNPLWDVLLERDFIRGRQPAIVEAWADDAKPQAQSGAAQERSFVASAPASAAPAGASAPSLPDSHGKGNCPPTDSCAVEDGQRHQGAMDTASGTAPVTGPLAGVSARLQRLLVARGGSKRAGSGALHTARRAGSASARRQMGLNPELRASKRHRDSSAPAESRSNAVRAKLAECKEAESAASPDRRATTPDVPGWELGCETAASTSASELRSRGERSVVAYQRLWSEWDRQRRLRDIAPLTACPRCGVVAMDLRSVQSGMAVGSYRRCLACRNVVMTAYSRPDTRMFAGAFMGSV